MLFRLRASENIPKGVRFQLSFYQATQLIPAETGDYRLAPNGMNRSWREWDFKPEQNRMLGGFHEEGESGAWDLHIAVGASSSCRFDCKPVQNRYSLLSARLLPDEEAGFAVTFDPDGDLSAAECRTFQRESAPFLYGTIRMIWTQISCTAPGPLWMNMFSGLRGKPAAAGS